MVEKLLRASKYLRFLPDYENLGPVIAILAFALSFEESYNTNMECLILNVAQNSTQRVIDKVEEKVQEYVRCR